MTSIEGSLPDGAAARQLISELRNGRKKLGMGEVVRRALSAQEVGRVTDAYLLLFYAARQGDAQAAFALASLYDPNHFSPGIGLLEAPDSLQAYKWYRFAASQQVPNANQRLQALHETIKKQATAGDPMARRLLLNWQ